ncbi:hypothetical protein GH714_037673 [Hevea brasiliensis]|uniref:Uncharacterized protein n=1 Tax=Hevea brasiliensis TaxID=3981 RepID=A0A6A6KME6_HEVBR|nr:hypothetical protein GH714_037630 [Hevea brasiliensis]KAF2289642.1 hypothetical protein GH714_037664 [Hevea brasiliensis]KAF2289644.1 hypothetical protein GH714_037673 [Hevea brasiliensis]
MNENPVETSKDYTFHALNKLRTELQGPVTTDKAVVIEMLFPSVFRAIVSLHPASSIDQDVAAFFSADEGGADEWEDLRFAAMRELRKETGVTSAEFLAEVGLFSMNVDYLTCTL